MKKFTDILFTVVMVLVLTFAFLLVGIRLFGLQPYTVISGSMEPEYHVGSIIYVKKATASELAVNDTITFVSEGGIVVTHRIIEIFPDEDNPTVVRYRTKGDANNVADGSLVHINNVIGKPVFSIPLIGYIAYFVQNPPGTYIIICVLAIFLMISFLPNLLDKFRSDNEAANNEKAQIESPLDSPNEEENKTEEITDTPVEESSETKS